jgi:cell division protein FtsN
VAQEPKTVVQITRRGMAVWVLLILFIAGWMFVLGIMVGRGMAPMPLDTDRLQQELSELKSALMEKEQAEMEAQASGQADQKTQLGFYEVLKETKRPPHYAVPRTKPEATVKPAPNPAAQLPLQIETRPAAGDEAVEKPAPPAVLKSAPASAAPAKPPEPEKAVIKPAAAPEAKAPVAEKAAAAAPANPVAPQAGGFTIQVGAFKDAASAEQVVAHLRGKGFPSYQIRSESLEKGVWYRVRVGAFKDRATAQSMLKRLDAAQVNGIIVGTSGH